MSPGPTPSTRVEGWIWGAINPLLESLQAENRFLADANLTFRARTQQPEWIHHAADYLDPNGQILLEDLEFEHPELSEPLKRHDETYDEAAAAARDAYLELTKDPKFAAAISEAMSEFRAAHESVTERDVFPNADGVRVSAERFVNSIEVLDDQYADAEFWMQARPALAFFRQSINFGLLQEAIAAFKHASDELIAALKYLRRTLSRDHGVAPAPYRRA